MTGTSEQGELHLGYLQLNEHHSLKSYLESFVRLARSLAFLDFSYSHSLPDLLILPMLEIPLRLRNMQRLAQHATSMHQPNPHNGMKLKDGTRCHCSIRNLLVHPTLV